MIRIGVRLSLVSLLAATLGRTVESAGAVPGAYRLRFYNTHTNERLDIVYRRANSYLLKPAKLDRYLRDPFTGEPCIMSNRGCLICCMISPYR